MFRLWLALFVLNSALTFQNRWPTLWVRWVAELSIELAALLLALALFAVWRGALGRQLRYAVSSGYVVLTLGRYLDVTAPALMGRAINLYWDSQHLPNVAALFLDQAAPWQIALGLSALMALLITLAALLHWALGVVMTALQQAATRQALGGLALTLLALCGAGRWIPNLPLEHRFALPVTAMLAEQAQMTLAATLLRDSRWIARQPPLPNSDLGRWGKGDVLIIFFESQGALVFDDPRFAIPLADNFAALERSLNAAGWQVASARVESSTFGGGSWLAHSSLLSGLRIAEQGDYHDLLTSDRATLANRFTAAGYRSVALMPGLRHSWPEGRYYGFDRILDGKSLDYRGPAYGGWVIPDQYSLHRLHQIEIAPTNRPPLLVVFPTINSHAPFTPLPPYHPDWSDVAVGSDKTPSSDAVALGTRLDGEALATAYVHSVRYNLEVLGGYLHQFAPANALLLVLGDHQPPAIVAGRDSSWQTPVHVFSRNPDLIRAFQAAGFQAGIKPGPTALGGIENLGPLLLRILDGRADRALTDVLP